MDIRKENELDRQMDLLQMKEISTYRQQKNGTRIFQLPIKKYGQYIEVGSFESGYVRRMNGCYTPYQLNKCEPTVEYYRDYKWHTNSDGDYTQKFTGKYNKYVGKKRIPIMDELDRLEYLITYCLKNYYINQANEIENGKFISKWKHEYEMKNGSMDRVRELQDEIRRMKDYNYDKIEGLNQEIDKLNNEIVDSRDRGMLDNLTVFVNNEKYKII